MKGCTTDASRRLTSDAQVRFHSALIAAVTQTMTSQSCAILSHASRRVNQATLVTTQARGDRRLQFADVGNLAVSDPGILPSDGTDQPTADIADAALDLLFCIAVATSRCHS